MSNYVILGVKEGATIVEIKTRYRILCKEYHPDKTGGDRNKTAKFLLIKDAYEALLKGDSGKVTQNKKYNTNSNFSRKQDVRGTYRFITIKSDNIGYIVSFSVHDVDEITIDGKNFNRVGTYDVKWKEGIVNLRVKFKDAKKADYTFKIKLYDSGNYSAEVNYKVKPPKQSTYSRVKDWVNKLF